MTIGPKMLVSQLVTSLSRMRRDDKKDANQLGNQPDMENKRRSQEFDVQNILPDIQSLAGIRKVLDKIVKGMVEGLGYTGAMLAVLESRNQTLSVQAIAFNDFIHRLGLIDKVEGVCGIKIVGSSASLVDNQDNIGVKTCLTGQTMITHNLYDLFHPALDSEISRQIQTISGVQTCISIPLSLEGRVVGNLCAGTGKSEFSAADLEALHFFVTNAAIAVQNSILFEQVNRKLLIRETELHQLREIEKMINSSLDLHEVLKRILDGAINLTRADYGHVVLAGHYASGLVQRVSYPEGPKVLNGGTLGITQLIMRDKKPKLIDNAHLVELKGEEIKYLPDDDYDLHSYSKMKSQLGVPISLGDELMGVIHIASPKSGAFNKHSLDMLEQLAIQAAIAIRNAHQFKVEREMRERFTNLAQVVAMGDMASNMVHSINNWVGAIRADLYYLKRQQARGKFSLEELTELIEDMLENAEATLAMAENIRKPFQGFTQEPIDVNGCILNVLQEKRDECKNIMIIKDLDNLPLVMATQQLELVFENLLNNALQAMKDKDFGTLKFATRCSSDGQWVEIIVKDSGTGLPKHLNEQEIFKLGVSGKTDGLGYGLWWCDTVLKRWGGNIQLVENSQAGCRFLIRLSTRGANL